MPFTPFHLGPAIVIGLLALKYLDFPTFVAANLVVDWRATLVFFDIIEGPLHSWPSTFPGSIVTAAALGTSMLFLRPRIDRIMQDVGIEQDFGRKKIFAAAFTGVFLHVMIDAFHHPNVYAFMVEGFRPFYGLMSTGEVRLVCTALLVFSVPLYIYHVRDRLVGRR